AVGPRDRPALSATRTAGSRPRRAGRPSGLDPPPFRVDVQAAAAHEAAQRDPAVGGELDGEARRGADRDQDRAAGDGRLLDELEREAPADAEDRVGERQPVLEEGPADDLVHRVVAAHVLPQAEELAVRVEEAGRMEPARDREGGLGFAQPVGQAREELEAGLEPAVGAGRVDRDRLERALAADAARGARVEAPLDSGRIEAGRVELDRVRGEVGRGRGRDGAEALGQAEAERKLLLVARSSHRYRDRLSADPDLERVLDSDPVLLLAALRQPDDV